MNHPHISSKHAEEFFLFRVESIESVPPPDGHEGDWSRYVITQGNNTVVGMRAGDRAYVGGVIAQYVEQLNQRFAKPRTKSGR